MEFLRGLRKQRIDLDTFAFYVHVDDGSGFLDLKFTARDCARPWQWEHQVLTTRWPGNLKKDSLMGKSYVKEMMLRWSCSNLGERYIDTVNWECRERPDLKMFLKLNQLDAGENVERNGADKEDHSRVFGQNWKSGDIWKVRRQKTWSLQGLRLRWWQKKWQGTVLKCCEINLKKARINKRSLLRFWTWINERKMDRTFLESELIWRRWER